MGPKYLANLTVGARKNAKLSSLKSMQKEEQKQHISLNYPPAHVEQEVLSAESAQVIVLGYIERRWTCQQVVKVLADFY